MNNCIWALLPLALYVKNSAELIMLTFFLLILPVSKPDLSDQTLYERSVIVAKHLRLAMPGTPGRILIQNLPLEICCSFGVTAISFSKVDGHVSEVESEIGSSKPEVSVDGVRTRQAKYFELYGVNSGAFRETEVHIEKGNFGEPKPIHYVRIKYDRVVPDQGSRNAIRQLVFSHGSSGGFSAMASTRQDFEFRNQLEKSGKIAEFYDKSQDNKDRRVDVSKFPAEPANVKLTSERIQYGVYGK